MAEKDIRRTLLFLQRDDEVLLAMKKRGFGSDRWNGVGGKLEPGETLEEATIRECQEEVGVTPLNFWKVAELDFTGGSDVEQWKNYVYAYLCDSWEGVPGESEEMRPEWFTRSSIPLDQMWDADKLWVPRVLAGEAIRGTILFDEQDQVVNAAFVNVKPYE